MDVFCIDSVNIDCIECIRDPCPVSTVSTYIVYSNAIVYCVWYLFCRHCRYEDQTMQCIDAMFVETVDTLLFVAFMQHLIESNMRCENTSINSLDIA